MKRIYKKHHVNKIAQGKEIRIFAEPLLFAISSFSFFSAYLSEIHLIKYIGGVVKNAKAKRIIKSINIP
ncbi:MAG: hypothetical protein LBC61_07105 [Candidatus Peribacteria bacterium]|nr:hypothetical protein [Candidatus Peribacteria bacterium]